MIQDLEAIAESLYDPDPRTLEPAVSAALANW